MTWKNKLLNSPRVTIQDLMARYGISYETALRKVRFLKAPKIRGQWWVTEEWVAKNHNYLEKSVSLSVTSLDLRDQFAMASLPAIISAYAASHPLYADSMLLQNVSVANQIIAEDAYDLADKMIEVRGK